MLYTPSLRCYSRIIVAITIRSILTWSLLPTLSIHIFLTFHLLLLPSLSHYTLSLLSSLLDKSPSIRQATASVIEAVSCNSEGCSTVTTNVLLAACTKGLEDDDGEVQDAYAKAVAAVLFEQITAYAAMQSLQRASSNRGGSNTGDSANNNGDGTNSNSATPNKGASPQKRPSGGSTAMSTRLKNLLSSQKKIIDEYDFRNVILSVIKQVCTSLSLSSPPSCF